MPVNLDFTSQLQPKEVSCRRREKETVFKGIKSSVSFSGPFVHLHFFSRILCSTDYNQTWRNLFLSSFRENNKIP